MLRNRIYYRVKPLIPQSLRMMIRRRLALRVRNQTTDTWPIMPGSERPPQGWPGWPEGKKFAVVLTHDVESEFGLRNVWPLAQLEREMGFRSSFNFIPEGTYRVPADLRLELEDGGWEVGIHDLHHDGRLFESRREFTRHAARINQFLHHWGSVGFRSGFMLHNLDWLNALNIEYDASTFDTDPFEPQPEGRRTIFPFWVPAPRQESELTDQRSDARNQASEVQLPPSDFRSPFSHPSAFPARSADSSACEASRGYVELPYTLPQDSTLFLLLKEKTIAVWSQKLAWIADHGGMVLLDVHPDYINFNGRGKGPAGYSADRYRQFLAEIATQYSGSFWHALPRSVARYARQCLMPAEAALAG